jgi:uncharacterized protein YbbK (DUF523 family)
LVSACLLGTPCRYDGQSKPALKVIKLLDRWQKSGTQVVAVCPEQLGGLTTPRPAAELKGGDGHLVLDGKAEVRTLAANHDVTQEFITGAKLAWQQAPNAELAILKARSPSCGHGQTEIDGKTCLGDGVLAALLKRNNIRVINDEDYNSFNLSHDFL